MAEAIAPRTPEEAAALRALAAKHRRRGRWFALLASMIVSFHATAILGTLWHGWPLAAHALWWLAFFVMNAVVGLAWLAWGLRNLREVVGGKKTAPEVGTLTGGRSDEPETSAEETVPHTGPMSGSWRIGAEAMGEAKARGRRSEGG